MAYSKGVYNEGTIWPISIYAYIICLQPTTRVGVYTHLYVCLCSCVHVFVCCVYTGVPCLFQRRRVVSEMSNRLVILLAC